MTRGLVLVVAIGLAAVILAPASAREKATNVIDRTFSCEIGYLGGVYQATVESYWFVPQQGGRRIPSATVTTNLTDGFLGGISSSSIHVNRLHCKATSAKPALTTRGMRGGAFAPLGADYDCFTPRRVLLRIRSDFVKPTTLRTTSRFGFPQLQAFGAMTRAELAVATLAGKPIAYASIAGATKTRLFTSSNCEED